MRQKAAERLARQYRHAQERNKRGVCMPNDQQRKRKANIEIQKREYEARRKAEEKEQCRREESGKTERVRQSAERAMHWKLAADRKRKASEERERRTQAAARAQAQYTRSNPAIGDPGSMQTISTQASGPQPARPPRMTLASILESQMRGATALANLSRNAVPSPVS
jgi:hypothetical protein